MDHRNHRVCWLLFRKFIFYKLPIIIADRKHPRDKRHDRDTTFSNSDPPAAIATFFPHLGQGTITLSYMLIIGLGGIRWKTVRRRISGILWRSGGRATR